MLDCQKGLRKKETTKNPLESQAGLRFIDIQLSHQSAKLSKR